MKRYEFKRSPIQTNLLIQYSVTNMCNTNLLGVNSKDLSEDFLFDSDQILHYYNESVVTNLIRLHVSLSTI